MKKLGILLSVIGVLILLYALSMKTYVESGANKINNIGLLSDKQNYLMIAGIALIIGVLMVLLGKPSTLRPARTLEWRGAGRLKAANVDQHVNRRVVIFGLRNASDTQPG